jgi:putative addiction module component (TIGR02574 family)
MSIDEIKRLDITERIILVEEIWDSIAKEQENLGLTEYEKKVLDERLSSLQKNPNDLLSWDMIKKRVKE